LLRGEHERRRTRPRARSYQRPRPGTPDVLRLDGVAADVLERIGVGIRRISLAGLEQQNRAGRVLTEAACHDTTGRASAHDDDAEGCSRGFLVRPEIHGYDI
jgi:hypothetical protein